MGAMGDVGSVPLGDVEVEERDVSELMSVSGEEVVMDRRFIW